MISWVTGLGCCPPWGSRPMRNRGAPTGGREHANRRSFVKSRFGPAQARSLRKPGSFPFGGAAALQVSEPPPAAPRMKKAGLADRPFQSGGAEGSRTPDLHNAIVALFQLSYDPTVKTGGQRIGSEELNARNFFQPSSPARPALTSPPAIRLDAPAPRRGRIYRFAGIVAGQS